MELLNVKTARFAAVVAKCGTPEVVTLWQDPAKDREFQRLIREHKLMTLHQMVVGSKKDFGEVGYMPEGNVSFLAFPKSLKSFAGRRVIGVDYSRLEAPAALTKPATKRAPRAAVGHLAMEAPIKPKHPAADSTPVKAPRKEKAKSAPEEISSKAPAPAAPPLDPFMFAAINEARKSLTEDGVPTGAAIVRGKKLVAVSHNRRVQEGDPLAHAEADCLRAAGRLGPLRGSTLYSTVMPCFLCAGAAVQFGIKRVIVADSRNFKGAVEFLREHAVEVVDLDLAECREMLAAFIREHPKVWRENIGEA